MSSKKTRRQQRKKNKQTNNKKVNKMKNNHKQTKTSKTLNAWGSSLPSKASCHTGQELIFTSVEGIEVYAGGKNRNGGWHKMNPYPQLAMGPSETLKSYSALDRTVVPEGWSCEQHLSYAEPPLFISLDWPDYSIPAVDKYFWYAVIDDIREHGIKTVSTQCAGGHGRTGVQLAILAYLLGTEEERAAWPDAGVLVEWVRDKHCVHAVEAKSQQQYIADVCDIPLGEDKIHTTTSYGYGGGGWGKAATTPTTVGTDVFNEEWSWDKKADDHSGLIIDEVGADYCPHCGHKPIAMIPFGAMCQECGLDPQVDPSLVLDEPTTKKVKVDVDCPACGFDIIIDDECAHCGYDLGVGEMKGSTECTVCGKAKSNKLSVGGTHCLTCVVDEQQMDTKKVVKYDKKATDNMKLKCSPCNKFLDSKFIARIDHDEGVFICFKCDADPKKELIE